MTKKLLTVAALAFVSGSVLQAQTIIFNKNASWRYKDNNQALVSQWKDTNFDIASWSTGNGPLGYGDPVTTTINSGLITAYFAKDFIVNLADLSDTMELGVMRDDGIVVYLNGQEVVRDNMPAGTITFNTPSSTTIDGAAENVYNVFSIPKSKFVNGNNRLSIELHNRSGQSSDLRIDAYLKTVNSTTNPVSCNAAHISCFTSIVPTSQTNKLIIPTEHKYQLILKEGDAYTQGGGLVGGQNDFTAYVPKSASSTNGYLSVNHETNPGGVTMAEINYNASTKLWQLTKSRAVDFSTPSLVQTIRNCSGGITPWGTVVTAEESVTSSDTNGDGYKDYGWLVEIDPATAQVISKNTDGSKGKLWQMGIMNHENVVINNAGTIAYYGEDGGTHLVYKYVMDTPNDLSSGNLYVLKLDQGLSTGGDPVGTTATWIQVPNKTKADQNNTNNLAFSLGGTKFNGIEDVDISPLDGKIYFTAKGLNKVYRLQDNGTTASQVETFVGGLSTVYSFNTAQGMKSEVWGDGNDNLTFDELGNLWVLQDGGKNYIWVVAPDHTQANPKVRLFASMPAGSEPTGLTFTPDHKFGFFSIQHPDSTISTDVDATGNTIDYRGKSATIVVALKNNLGSNGSLGTIDTKVENTVTVAPNPTSGIVKINSPKGLKDISVTAYSMDGKIVYTKKFTGSNTSLELDFTSQLEVSHVLVLNIEAEGFQKTVKLLKK
ncbi:twin-arginine translocation pathway signal protein [Chryseobacterium piperi]|uniref:Twin-arginine translocation pathway signal protein n=1 Tax=Chryseobacterium piperi TaxID=558152 RepID=A0A086BK06_9FLAO|nr:alkaline phosphatase PhoX [Chryseobacterium piperi]ASW73826.1 twin-arginine translocation pathway signal protein [Chryseobacterium piperi]KFF29270.1 twin-arginine translocation pathway signal protein [Chryseobacterium piperi]